MNELETLKPIWAKVSEHGPHDTGFRLYWLPAFVEVFLPETTFAVALPEHFIVVSPSLQATVLLLLWEKMLSILRAQRDC